MRSIPCSTCGLMTGKIEKCPTCFGRGMRDLDDKMLAELADRVNGVSGAEVQALLEQISDLKAEIVRVENFARERLAKE